MKDVFHPQLFALINKATQRFLDRIESSEPPKDYHPWPLSEAAIPLEYSPPVEKSSLWRTVTKVILLISGILLTIWILSKIFFQNPNAQRLSLT